MTDTDDEQEPRPSDRSAVNDANLAEVQRLERAGRPTRNSGPPEDFGRANDSSLPGLNLLGELQRYTPFHTMFVRHSVIRFAHLPLEQRVEAMALGYPRMYKAVRITDFVYRLIITLVIILAVAAGIAGVLWNTFIR